MAAAAVIKSWQSRYSIKDEWTEAQGKTSHNLPKPSKPGENTNEFREYAYWR
jgi:hypothetical protein